METLRRKVKSALIDGFPRATVPRLEKGENGIIGVVVSARFRGKQTRQRIRLVDEALHRHLTDEEFLNVTIIMPMTPEEAKARPDLMASNGLPNSD